MVIAYADPRAYIDRLNNVCGPCNWSTSYKVHLTEKKIVVEATVNIPILYNSHSSLGEDTTTDENCATAAEAQAFKRACMPFGLGRYLYDLPRFWVKYDKEGKKMLEQPKLPDWAVPQRKCEKCTKSVTAYKTDSGEMSATAVIARAQREYGGIYCAECMIQLKKERAPVKK